MLRLGRAPWACPVMPKHAASSLFCGALGCFRDWTYIGIQSNTEITAKAFAVASILCADFPSFSHNLWWTVVGMRRAPTASALGSGSSHSGASDPSHDVLSGTTTSKPIPRLKLNVWIFTGEQGPSFSCLGRCTLKIFAQSVLHPRQQHLTQHLRR